MSHTRLILCDVDETILEFANPFQEWVATKGFVPEGRLRDNYKIEEWLGVERSVAVDLMTEFGKSDGPYHGIAEPDALAVLPKLYKEGFRFVAITACGTDPIFAARRVNILADTFGFTFEGVHYVEHRASKADVLASFRPTYWVEDNLRHAVDGALLGHHSFLLNRGYNQEPEGHDVLISRVDSWHDIYEVVQ